MKKIEGKTRKVGHTKKANKIPLYTQHTQYHYKNIGVYVYINTHI